MGFHNRDEGWPDEFFPVGPDPEEAERRAATAEAEKQAAAPARAEQWARLWDDNPEAALLELEETFDLRFPARGPDGSRPREEKLTSREAFRATAESLESGGA